MRAKGITAPSLMVRVGAIILSALILRIEPRPLHCGQAPSGALKEKERGSSSLREMPQSLQAKFSLKRKSSVSCGLSGKAKLESLIQVNTTKPLANFKASSVDWLRRLLKVLNSFRSLSCSRLITKRSTNASILCLLVLIRFNS